MSALPWGLMFLAALVLGTLVQSSLSGSVPKWIKSSITALLGSGVLVYAIGILLAIWSKTTMPTPDGGVVIKSAAPPFIIFMLWTIIVAALAVALIGIAYIAQGWLGTAQRAIEAERGRHDGIGATVGKAGERLGWRRAALGLTLAVFGGLLIYYSGPIVVTQDGISGVGEALVGAAGLGLVIAGLGMLADWFHPYRNVRR